VIPTVGFGEVDNEIAIRVETGGEGTHGGGFAGANVAGNQPQPLLAQQEGQASSHLLLRLADKEVIGGDVALKRQTGEAIKLLIHG
jgi:hypothetical protein